MATGKKAGGRKRTATRATAPDAPANVAGKDPGTSDLGADGATPLVSVKEARKVPMYVASEIHLKGKDGKRVIIRGGVLLDELEEDISDDQLDELIALKAIRPASQDEIAAADARAEAE